MLLMSENCEWNTDTTVNECNTDTKLKKDVCAGIHVFLHSRNQEVPAIRMNDWEDGIAVHVHETPGTCRNTLCII